MIRNLKGITLPKETDFLWRYMSFEKFVSLLSEESLFFSRVDKFEDPFEGFIPPSVTEHYERNRKNIYALEDFQKSLHKSTLCNC